MIDAWIEATLPNGSTLEIISREDLSIQPGDTLVRLNLMQFVPATAPAGIYTYTLYAGNYLYQSPWGEDGFSFEKLGDRDWGLGTGENIWALTGFFDGASVGARHASPLQPDESSYAGITLSVHPNPFNQTASIRFTLPQAGEMRLEVFDVNGREVGSGQSRPLRDGWMEAGTH